MSMESPAALAGIGMNGSTSRTAPDLSRATAFGVLPPATRHESRNEPSAPKRLSRRCWKSKAQMESMPPGAAPTGGGGGGGDGDRGVVKSVASAGGYSYIEVERSGSTLWVAAMETPMKPGDKVQWQGGSQMNNFTAKALGRTFERITFASSVAVVP